MASPVIIARQILSFLGLLGLECRFRFYPLLQGCSLFQGLRRIISPGTMSGKGRNDDVGASPSEVGSF